MRRAASLLLALCTAAVTLPGLAGECHGTVYLTFDTGNMAQAETIARVLNQEQVRATFFVANEKTFRGDRALEAPWRDFWRARVAEGHAFGNHTDRHIYARQDLAGGLLRAQVNYDGPEVRLDEKAFCGELKKADARFHELTGSHLSGLWRAPGGHTTRQTIRWAAGCGYPVHVHWDPAGFLGDELDSARFPNARLLDQALANIRPGTVTLMHLGVWSRKEPLAPILEPLIRGLKARGLCFAPLLGTAR